MTKIIPVEPEIPAVVAQVVRISFVPVKGNISAILADVPAVVANIYFVVAGVPMAIETTLGLGRSGSQQQTSHHQYGKFLFHDLTFLCGSIANSYIRR